MQILKRLFIGLTGIIALTFSQSGLGAVSEKITVLAIGDSTTAGTPAFRSPAEVPPNGSGNEKSQYAYWIIQKHSHWTVWNRGIAGQRSDQILVRFKREINFFHSDVVVVLAGVNDLYQGYSAEHVKSNLKQIYALAVEKNIKVLACTILPYDESRSEVRLRMAEVNDWIRSYSKDHGFMFCDTFKLLDNLASPGHLIGTPDGFHPDAEGYRKMGEASAEVIADLKFK